MEELYALISEANWHRFVRNMWPNAVKIDGHRLIQFSENEEVGLINLCNTLGYEYKECGLEEAREIMDKGLPIAIKASKEVVKELTSSEGN